MLYAAVESLICGCGLVASGAGDRLIAVTDMCDRPPGVKTRRHIVSFACYPECLTFTGCIYR